MSKSTERTIVRGFGLALLVLVVNAAVSYRNIQILVTNGGWVVHTREVLGLLEGIVSTLREAEVAQRSYLITGAEALAAEFEPTSAKVLSTVAELRRLTADNGSQVERIDRLEEAARERLAVLRKIIQTRRDQGFEAARSAVEVGEAREVIGRFLAAAGKIRSEENTLLDLRTAAERTSIWQTLATFSVATALALGLLGAAFYLVRRDIAERERSEAVLRESEQRVRLLLNSTGEGIYGTDLAGGCTFVNQAGLKLLGYDSEETLLGQPLHDLIHHSRSDGSPLPVQECRIYQAFQLGEGTQSEGEIFWRKDGSGFPVEYRSHPIRRSGQVIGAVVTFSDITERRRADETMRLRDRSLRAIAQGLFITDPSRSDEPIIYVNAAFEHITGYEQDEVIGLDIRFLRGPKTDPVALNEVWAAFREKREASAELLGYRKDGATFWASLSVSPVQDDSGRVTHFVGVMTDVSERRRAEEELQQAKSAAEAASRSKSTFLANMSHELRTPLNAIMGYSEMLREEAEDTGQDGLVPDLDKIHNAGRHLLGLINDILDLSKIEAGKMDIYLETFEVAGMVNAVVDTIRPLAEKNGDTIRVECPPEIGRMHADLTKLRQILLNLLSNAIKFTDRGTVTLDAARERSDQGDRIVLKVRDSGIGMSADQVARLFQPFTQADASTTRKYGGTGLGLTITRHFSQMMGGDVSVESAPGEGSTFTLRLPAEVLDRGTATHPPDHDGTRPGPASGNLVLVVDDDPAVLELMRRALEKDAYRVRTATGGEEALRLARELRPDAVTLDVMMPGMDGWAVLTALKSDPETAEIPVVMISFVDNKNLGYALGAADYLTKPIDRNRLSAILRKYRRAHPDTAGLGLVVDDDEASRHMVRQLLERDGWAVSEAENGRVGLERVAEARPDLIILDLMMPEMDGFGFAEALRKHEQWQAIPILVVTAKDLTDEDRRRLNGHILGILQKGPYTRDELLTEIRQEVAKLVRTTGHTATSRA